MIFRNKELKRAMGIFLCLSILLIVPSFLYGRNLGILLLLSQGMFLLLFFLTERNRYRKIQKISEDLDELLLYNTSLPIDAYEEGDLSALAHQVQKLTQKLTEARNASQKDKAFLADALADISHQLRTPLTAMHLTLSLLAQPEIDGEKHRELLRELRNLLHRTQWLVEALLKLSKLDAGTVPLRQEAVPLLQVLEQAVSPFSITMELQEQHLSIRCEDCILYCDPAWTAEAIGNVIKNATEHSPVGSTITLSGRDTPIFTEITVEDEGGGFPPEELPHIFKRFYRGQGADPKSCGIGLSLSHSILAAQNGNIQAENTEKGGKFTIKLYKQFP